MGLPKRSRSKSIERFQKHKLKPKDKRSRSQERLVSTKLSSTSTRKKSEASLLSSNKTEHKKRSDDHHSKSKNKPPHSDKKKRSGDLDSPKKRIKTEHKSHTKHSSRDHKHHKLIQHSSVDKLSRAHSSEKVDDKKRKDKKHPSSTHLKHKKNSETNLKKNTNSSDKDKQKRREKRRIRRAEHQKSQDEENQKRLEETEKITQELARIKAEAEQRVKESEQREQLRKVQELQEREEIKRSNEEKANIEKELAQIHFRKLANKGTTPPTSGTQRHIIRRVSAVRVGPTRKPPRPPGFVPKQTESPPPPNNTHWTKPTSTPRTARINITSTRNVRSFTTVEPSDIDFLTKELQTHKQNVIDVFDLERPKPSSRRGSKIGGIAQSAQDPQGPAIITKGSAIGGPNGRDRARELMRKRIVDELLATERSYVQSMDALLVGCIWPSIENNILTEAQKENAFLNFEEIFQYHKEFVKCLERRILTWDPVCGVGDLFLDRIGRINIYEKYFMHYSFGLLHLHHLLKVNPQFAQLKHTFERSTKSLLDIESYLIMPVQRIPRYALLLKELMKFTNPEHKDFVLIESAKQKLEHLLNEINDKKEKTTSSQEMSVEEINKMLSIESSIDNLHISLLGSLANDSSTVTQRKYLMEGEVSLRRKDNEAKTRNYVFLFTDMLLLCGMRNEHSGKFVFEEKLELKAIDGVSEDSGLLGQTGKGRKGLGMSVRAKAVGRSLGAAKSFNLWLKGGTEMYTFVCKNRKDMEEWKHCITKHYLESQNQQK